MPLDGSGESPYSSLKIGCAPNIRSGDGDLCGERLMAGRLDGKVAIVTGAARGQGEAEARLFAAEGAAVVLTDVLEDQASLVAKDIGNGARAMGHDVSSEDDWAKVVAAATSEFGRLDVLVNNAAIHHIVPIEAETRDAFERILAVNLVGTFLGMQAVLEPMRAAGGGSIVNISSLAGIQGFYGHGAYGASKWGVTGMTKVAAIEFGPSNIRVNSVHPGTINTDMFPGEPAPGRFDTHPIARVGEPGEVAELALFLASDASAYITGAQLVIDGGLGTGLVPPGKR
jgi:3alpha(or 20beta)-hydroxysteroid dehydrogenase